jgi:hypothetical protein
MQTYKVKDLIVLYNNVYQDNEISLKSTIRTNYCILKKTPQNAWVFSSYLQITANKNISKVL